MPIERDQPTSQQHWYHSRTASTQISRIDADLPNAVRPGVSPADLEVKKKTILLSATTSRAASGKSVFIREIRVEALLGFRRDAVP